jgi:microsomal epoxide hydrolase
MTAGAPAPNGLHTVGPASAGVTPVRVDVSDGELADIERELARFDWSLLPHRPGWSQGVPADWLQKLTLHWLTDYDWAATQAALNRHRQVLVDVGDTIVHAQLEPGSGPTPKTVILLHGWPYSFATFRHVIDRLAHPERYGRDISQALTVVVPSLPGAGFTPLPRTPMGTRSTARIIGEVADTLGYDSYAVHGGDQGALIADWLAYDRPDRCTALHTTLLGLRHDGAPIASGLTGAEDATDEERAFAHAELTANAGPAGAYFSQQISAPGTLAPALLENPVGVLAWVAEKLHLWSDPTLGDLSPDDLITEVMIHLVSRSTATSLFAFSDYFTEPITLPAGSRITVPSGFSAYPDPRLVAPPRGFVSRSRNLVYYDVPPAGGHFPALEVPAEFTDDLLRSLRDSWATTT